MTGPQPAGGGFRVEVDSAAQAIRELEDALRELHNIRQKARSLEQVNPPATDSVSREAALALSNVAVVGKGSFGTALDDGIAQLQATIAALKASLRTYSNSDEAAAIPASS